MTLLEKYSKRIKLAESVYAQTHDGQLSDNKKLVLAKALDNVNSL